MDDPGELPESEDDLFLTLVALAHVVGLIGGLRCCWLRCCRAAAAGASAEEALQLGPEQLQEKKRMSTSYLLWLVGGFYGAHHFYLGRIVHGPLAALSLNLFGFGWLADAVLIPSYVRGFNSRYTWENAPYDSSRRSLLCRLPAALLTCAALVLGIGLYLPRALHWTGVVDIDRLAAQTEANPYDTLGLSWDASLSDAKAAYRRESMRWHPDKNQGCGKRCEDKMAEIAKAFELIKKRRAPPPTDRTWEAWLQGAASDWLHVFEALVERDSAPPQQSAGAAGAGARKAGNGGPRTGSSGAKSDL